MMPKSQRNFSEAKTGGGAAQSANFPQAGQAAGQAFYVQGLAIEKPLWLLFHWREAQDQQKLRVDWLATMLRQEPPWFWQ